MKNRPKSVTVISWILIVLGIISTISSIATSAMLDNAVARELLSKSPIPIPVQYVIMYASLLIMIVSGFAMLKGFNWGRLLYVASTSISFLIGLATSPVRAGMIPGIVFFIVVAFFLFRPKASAYFSPAKATDDAQRV